MPAGREMVSAKFKNNGVVIVAILNFPSIRRIMPCRAIFDQNTIAKLGTASLCSSSGLLLEIFLNKGASVAPSDTLTIDATQTAFDDVMGGYFSGSVVVDTCDACLPPVPNVVHPLKISSGCSGVWGDAIFDATYSIDPAGRPLTHSWSIDSDFFTQTSNEALEHPLDFSAISDLADAERYAPG